ncbi:MAG: excinuclease ABC subunit C [Bacteroidales bacterium]|nr:excinuclease ABC subunit C [Bacteroidales bacterium]
MEVRDKIEYLPQNPGVYRYLDSEGTIIYVGKAKNLKKRVSQYFGPPESLNRKTRVMVSKIADLEYTVVGSEQDALLLENSLIKEFQPRYNILLKDGKTYPWISIRNEPFPRIITTRRYIKDGSLYFGPYSSAYHAKQLITLISGLYKLRDCKLSLTPEKISAGKYRPCLNHHIGKCAAPCVGLMKEEEYNRQIDGITSLLKGDFSALKREFKEKMNHHSRRLEFEKAQEYKEKLELLDNYYSKSVVVGFGGKDIDAFSFVEEGNDVFSNFIRVRQGAIVHSFNMELKVRIEQSREEILSEIIAEIISRFGELSQEVLVPFLPDQEFEGKNLHIPVRGDKKALLELSRKNAAQMKINRLKQEEALRPEEHRERIIANLQKDLGMENPPHHIECFDNSNIQGTDPVAACVVFRDGIPSKKEYRHFNIKSVVGANDYASMKEVVNRRYSRMIAEGESLPQLVIIDGGRGQVNFAHEALEELGIADQLTLVGLAERLEELIIPGDPTPLWLDKNSTSLRLLMQLRDEAHRFSLAHHRGKRSKRQIHSELSQIKGVGEVTQGKLLKQFRSVARIRQASFEELRECVGPHLAKVISDYFHSSQDDSTE